jgi:hypothetical protein
MIQWLNPWAWAGLGAIAIPIVVHLFSRRPPRVVEFPSLRFLEASALRPTRRSALSDLPLLCVRIALLAAAVIALAQPLWVDRSGRAAAETASRETPSRRETATAAATASVIERRTPQNTAYAGATDHLVPTGDSLVLFAESAELRTAITRAVAWLHTRGAPRALVVRSSFPLSAIDSTEVMALPRDVRLTLIHEVPSPSAGPTPIDWRAPRDTVLWLTALDTRRANDVVAAVHVLGGAVVLRVADTATMMDGIRHPLLVGAFGDSARVWRDAAVATGATSGEMATATSRLLAVSDDRTIRALVARSPGAEAPAREPDASPRFPLHFDLHFDASGHAALAGLVHNGMPVVMVQVPEHPALATATLLALSDNPTIRALRAGEGIDRNFRTAEVVQRWQQLPSAEPIGIGAGADRHAAHTWARWGWALALALAGVEWMMRRRSGNP